MDSGLHKTFDVTERYRVKAGIDVFNVSNSVRFDAQSISASVDNPKTFGNATRELTNPRLAQFFARFEF